MPQIAVYVKKEPYEVLRKICNKQHRTESQVIHDALMDYFSLYADQKEYKELKEGKKK